MEALWPGVYVDDHALSVQIREVRKALGDDPHHPHYIETRHRRGYRFLVIPQVAAPPATAKPVREPAAAVPVTHYARSGDVNIAYQVVGDGPIDLVFVMGWVSHLEYFWREPSFARFLRRLGSFARLILFDKRGTGLSDRVPISQLPTLEQRMDDVRAVMESVGSERAAICGVSEGGPMSALFSATYPERTTALVMIGAYAKRLRDAGYPWGPSAEEREAFFREIQEHWGGPVGIEERAPSMAHDPAFREWWAAYLRMGASPGAAVALTKMNAEIDVRHVLPAVRVPTLVLHRKGDRCLRIEEGRYVASLIPTARMVELPGEDHLPFVGDQEGMLDEIEEFLTGVRHTHEHETVLATVLCADFAGAAERLRPQIRSEIQWFRGREASPGGGGLLATFDGPARAVRCASAIAQHAARAGLTMRASLHTGECDFNDGHPVKGLAVTFAERILSLAAPGEILCSGAVRDITAGSGIAFEPRGQFSVKGVPGDWRLFRVAR